MPSEVAGEKDAAVLEPIYQTDDSILRYQFSRGADVYEFTISSDTINTYTLMRNGEFYAGVTDNGKYWDLPCVSEYTSVIQAESGNILVRLDHDENTLFVIRFG